MSEEIADCVRVIITRNDLQVRIKKPFDLKPGGGRSGRPDLTNDETLSPLSGALKAQVPIPRGNC